MARPRKNPIPSDVFGVETDLRDEPVAARAGRMADLSEFGLRSDITRKQRDEDVSQFHIEEEDIPEGWSVQWEVEVINGAPMKDLRADKLIETLESGWQYATTNIPSLRKYATPGQSDGLIRRGGQVLMMRPLHLTEQARAEEFRKSNDQINQKRRQLGQGGSDLFPRTVDKFKRTYERMEVPE